MNVKKINICIKKINLAQYININQLITLLSFI